MKALGESLRLWEPAPEVQSRLYTCGLPLHIVVSGPMGGGKSAVNSAVHAWAIPYDRAFYRQRRRFSVSWTSRGPRESEADGVDYWFNIERHLFEEACRNGELLECDRHAEEWYGTPTPELNTPMQYDIDVVGLSEILVSPIAIKRQFRDRMIAIYLAQQSMGQLLEQILNRRDGMDERQKISRASRYPGELRFILDNALPYLVVENIPGKQVDTIKKVLHLVAAERTDTLDTLAIEEKITEACDTLHDQRIEPILKLTERPSK